MSAKKAQQEAILGAIRTTSPGDWKVVVLDAGSRRLVEAALTEDDILKEHVVNIEQIEDRRPMNETLDAVYVLSPRPHIVDCLLADCERRRYRSAAVYWTGMLLPTDRGRLDHSEVARDTIRHLHTLHIDFFPKESGLVTFRDPWSFPILYHPACRGLVRAHLDNLAQRIVALCVALGEYPTIRYYRPPAPLHEAGALCSHLASLTQAELDHYAKHHHDFPPPNPRPNAVLIITDRSLDLFAPLLHEFTYQAMVHDLLPLEDGDVVRFKPTPTPGGPPTSSIEIGEQDRLWVDNRHLHMKDLLEKLSKEFQAFKAKNPQFAESDNPSSLNNIKDMLAGLPQYQEGKEAFSLHLNMASDAMALLQERKLVEIAAVEQTMATGVDDELKKPKDVADQIVRLLDDAYVVPGDRLRLVLQYLLYRAGLLPSDVQKLLAHAQLPAQDTEVVHNLALLGAHTSRILKDSRPLAQPLFPPKLSADAELSRFHPSLKTVIDEQVKNSLDQSLFPYTKPPLNADSTELAPSQSLRSAKPTWARTRPATSEPRQRVIVFMAGGATYSESRVGYEISHASNKEVIVASSHMMTPQLFLRQLRDLSVDRRRLHLPCEQPPPQAPAHLFERQNKPTPPLPPEPHGMHHAMGQMNLGPAPYSSPKPSTSTKPSSAAVPKSSAPAEKPEKDKKKRHFFGSKK